MINITVDLVIELNSEISWITDEVKKKKNQKMKGYDTLITK